MQLSNEVNDADHVQGNPFAPIILIEYGDYECPYCGAAYPVIKNLQRKFGDDMLFIYRNFPLAEIHRHAYTAACLAEASGIQDKFWQAHDILFENQRNLTHRNLMNIAEEIGTDVDQLVADMELDMIRRKIENDIESGLRSGVNGTPTFFINGKRYDGFNTFEDLMISLEYYR